jgi:hypothetical protein
MASRWWRWSAAPLGGTTTRSRSWRRPSNRIAGRRPASSLRPVERPGAARPPGRPMAEKRHCVGYPLPPEEVDRPLAQRHLFAIGQEHALHADPQPWSGLPDNLRATVHVVIAVSWLGSSTPRKVSIAPGESQTTTGETPFGDHAALVEHRRQSLGRRYVDDQQRSAWLVTIASEVATRGRWAGGPGVPLRAPLRRGNRRGASEGLPRPAEVLSGAGGRGRRGGRRPGG